MLRLRGSVPKPASQIPPSSYKVGDHVWGGFLRIKLPAHQNTRQNDDPRAPLPR